MCLRSRRTPYQTITTTKGMIIRLTSFVSVRAYSPSLR
jgi:hypothetical protein